MKEIIWLPQFKKEYYDNILFLLDEWDLNVVKEFEKKTNETIDLIFKDIMSLPFALNMVVENF